MTTESIVRDRQGSEYTLERLLGSGAMGSVYQAISRDKDPIAVKMPHARLSPELESRFWKEMEVLNRLQGPARGMFFPQAWPGALADSGRAVLCLTLMDASQDKRLVTIAAENAGHLPEQVALAAGVQYAQMIGVLHQMGISCPDRKPNDLYWNATRERLTVLDWNVVDEGDDFQCKRHQDIYIFGALWYELLTGSLPSPVDERLRRPLEKHPYWGEITYGMQRILLKCLAPAQSQRFQQASQLEQEMRDHWRDSVRPPDELVTDANAKLRQAQSQLTAAEDALGNAEGARYYDQERVAQTLAAAKGQISELNTALPAALRLADLARRGNAPGSERVWQEAEELQKRERDLIDRGSQRVLQVQYTAAAQWLDAAEGAVADDPSALLRLQRWRTLAEAGQTAIAEDLSLKPFLGLLAAVVEALEKGKYGQAESEWQRLQPRLAEAQWVEDTAAGRTLYAIGHEAAFRVAWGGANKAESERRFGDAVGLARDAFRHVEALAPAYAARVLGHVGHTLDSLRDHAGQLEARANVEGKIVDRLERGRSLLKQGDYEHAQAELLQGLALVGGDPKLAADEKNLRQMLAAAEWLPRLQDTYHSRNWEAMLATLERLSRENIDDETVLKPAREAVEDIMRQLKQAYGDGQWGPVKTTGQAQDMIALAEALNHFWNDTVSNGSTRDQRRLWLQKLMYWPVSGQTWRT